jgi:2',3'-cyclic-nucleotide 2'-phosphodiesterase/3'-nucleotidase
MKLKVIIGSLAFLLSASTMEAQEKVIDLKFVQTSDVHGNYFPYSLRYRKTGLVVWHVWRLL